jgi:hypothetical protein
MARRRSLGLLLIPALALSACGATSVHGISTGQLVHPPGSKHLGSRSIPMGTVTPPATTAASSPSPSTVLPLATPTIEVGVAPATTTTTAPPCSGEPSSSVEVSKALGGGISVSGEVTNGRSDTIDDVEVFFEVSPSGGGNAYVSGSILPGGKASWTQTILGQSNANDAAVVSSITYDDEDSFGLGCWTPGFGTTGP